VKQSDSVKGFKGMSSFLCVLQATLHTLIKTVMENWLYVHWHQVGTAISNATPHLKSVTWVS
jgi:hypothetical protein